MLPMLFSRIRKYPVSLALMPELTNNWLEIISVKCFSLKGFAGSLVETSVLFIE